MSPARPAPRTPRRSQRERRASTRAALLEGACRTLAERGHARATTPEICARAGVSQGALFKHFPSKAALIAATAEHVFAGLIERFRTGFARAAGEPDVAARALEELAAVFDGPEIDVAFELYVAARTDAALAASLAPVVARHGENLRAEAARLFPEALAHPDFPAVVDLTISALQGAALGRGLRGDDPGRADRQRLLLGLIRPLLAPEECPA